MLLSAILLTRYVAIHFVRPTEYGSTEPFSLPNSAKNLLGILAAWPFLVTAASWSSSS